MVRNKIWLLCLGLLSISMPLTAQFGLGTQPLRDNVISQQYNPANLMAGVHTKEYYGMILDNDSTVFKYALSGNAWLGNNGTSLQGVFGENGYIPLEVRERIANDLGKGSALGAGYDLGVVNLNVKIKDRQWSFFLEDKLSANARLNNGQTAGLIFLGNKYYEGETVADENVRFDLTQTRNLGFGLGWNKGENDRWKIGVRGKIVQGINTRSLRTANYSLFTDSLGTKIHAIADYNYVQARNDNPVGLFTFQGVGLAGDVGVIFQADTNLVLTASVLDVGAIFWNAERYESNFDVEWEGVEVTNLFNGDPGAQIDSTLDSLTNVILPDSSAETWISSTPTRMHIGAEYTLNEQMRLGAALWYAPFLNGPHTSLPLLNVSYHYKVIPTLELGANAFGGGNDLYGLGLMANYHFRVNKGKTRIDLLLGSDNLLGFAVPAAGRGMNAYAGLGVGM